MRKLIFTCIAATLVAPSVFGSQAFGSASFHSWQRMKLYNLQRTEPRIDN